MLGRENPAEFIETLSGSHRYILGYLTEEVLGRQDPDVQTFLLQTSILTKLNGDLCDAVTGRDDGSRMLERLFHGNLFLIPLDEEGRWYRYHHLFGELLRSLNTRTAESEIPELHQRAAQWYDSHSMGEEAMRHALSAQDYNLAVRYIERYASTLVMQGYARTVEAWMENIPEAQRVQSPKANMAFAWMHLLRGSYAQIAPFLERVASALDDPDLDAGEAAGLQVEMDALQSNLLHVQGRALESIDLANRALNAAGAGDFKTIGLANLGLGGAHRQAGDYDTAVAAYQKAIQASHSAGNFTSEMLGVSALTLMAMQHGHLRFAAEVGRQAIERMQRAAGRFTPIIGGVYGSLGLVYYEWNELNKAMEYYVRGERLSALSGHNASLI
jgi:LuxR family maltose regulon positive regulatory protein